MCGPDPTLEILVEVQQPNPVDSQEDGCDPEKIHNFRSPLVNTRQIIFIDYSLCVFDWLNSLIGPDGLLIVVSHLFGVSVSVSWVGLEKGR
jgi:hypothetical protein